MANLSSLASTFYPASGYSSYFDLVADRKDVINLCIGEPNFDTPAHIREAAKASLDRGGDTHYTPNAGLPA